MMSMRYLANSNQFFFNLNWTPIFEWGVVRHGSDTEHQRYICLKNIG